MIALSDPRIAAVPVRECGEPLVDLRAVLPLQVDPDRTGAVPVQVRSGVVDRLVTAQSLLPRGIRLLVVEGYPPPVADRTGGRRSCTAGSVAHRSGAAVDLMLCDDDLRPPPDPVRDRLLASALGATGLVNSPEHWWHWSYGDRYWALVAGAACARYGAVGGTAGTAAHLR